MRKSLLSMAALGLVVGASQASYAAGVTFAQFDQLTTTGQFAKLTNVAPTGFANDTLTNNGTKFVAFKFVQLANNGLLLGNDIRAQIVLSATANGPAVPTGGGNNQERFSNVTIQFLAKAASGTSQVVNGVTVNDGANLLTVKSQTGASALSGDALFGQGNSATLKGTDGETVSAFVNDVTFSSAFISSFKNLDDGYALSFSSVNPSFTRTGTQINKFTAAGTGTFSTTVVPEPGMIALLVAGGVGFTTLRLRRRKA